MPGDRETDEESQAGLPLSEYCVAVSRQLYLWLPAPGLTVAGGHRGISTQGHVVATMSYGNTLVLPQTNSQGTQQGQYQIPHCRGWEGTGGAVIPWNSSALPPLPFQAHNGSKYECCHRKELWRFK